MSKYLKTNYVDNGMLYDQFQGADPFLSMVLKKPKSGSKSGTSLTFPIAVGRSTSISSNFHSAQLQAKAGTSANKRQSVVALFDDDVYAVGRVGYKAEFATKDGAGAFVKAVEDESSMVMDSLKSRTSADIWRDGTGVIGQATSAVTTSATTFVLKSYADLYYFEVGMQFCAVGSLDKEHTVTKVNRGTKTITFTPVLGTAVAANGNFYFPANSDTAGAGSYDGVSKIITSTSLGTAYRGIDRSLDPTRLAGWDIDSKNYVLATNPRPILETIRRAAVLMNNFYRSADGKSTNINQDCYLGSAAWEALSDEIDQKTQLRRVNSSELKDGVLGFEGLQIIVSGKTVNVWACPTLNPLQGYLVDLDSWAFNWLGEGDKSPIQFKTMTNGTYFKDVDDDDSIEFRMQFHPILSCFAPGQNASLTFKGADTISRITNYLSTT